jgi:DegV family protein with EDD domain
MPSTIAVVTDTDASLPADLAEQAGILQVPITIHFGEQSFTSGKDIDDRQLFEKIDRFGQLPTTAAPSPSRFAATYEEAFRQGAEGVVCICVSSRVSSTHQSALAACQEFPGRSIRVIDSLTLSLGQGFMALAASQAARQGASLETVAQTAEALRERLHLYAVLATLKYLAMSGRVGRVAAGMANTLNIKPILTLRDGQLVLLEKVRTRARALERMRTLLRADARGRRVERIAVIHVNHPEGAAELGVQLAAEFPQAGPILTSEFGPGLSVHAGAGVVGVVLQTSA